MLNCRSEHFQIGVDKDQRRRELFPGPRELRTMVPLSSLAAPSHHPSHPSHHHQVLFLCIVIRRC